MSGPRPCVDGAPLTVHVGPAAEAMGAALEHGRHPLAVFRAGSHGALAPGTGAGAPTGSKGTADQAVAIDLGLPELGAEALHEVWAVAEAPARHDVHGFQVAATVDVSAGVRRFTGGDLDANTRAGYRDLARTLDALGHGAVRIWNVVPDIHGPGAAPGEGPDTGSDAAAFDRYMLFSKARSETFEELFGTGFEQGLSAATAVGGPGAEQVLAFVGCRTPGEAVENERQVSAYAYPEEYGPRSPSFARATRVGTRVGGRGGTRGTTDALLVSGTASIVGHRTVHAGDVAAQTRETCTNLQVLFEGRTPTALRAFVRHPADVDVVVAELRAGFGADVPIVLHQAEICRADLLVEVEGVVTPSVEASR